MTPAVKRALAYIAATGRIPSHLHIDTWCKVRECVSDAASPGRYVVRPECLELIATHPLHVACEWFKARGFHLESGHASGRGRTSHYVAWWRDGDLAGRVNPAVASFTGLAYRGGGGSVTVEHGGAFGAPFRTTWQLDKLGDAWPALLRPSMYVGEIGDTEHARAYLERAVAAYVEGKA